MPVAEPAVRPPLRFATLAEFWPFYISQHMSRANRRVHFAGTTLGILGVAAAVLRASPPLALSGWAGAYALAWYGHIFLERNRPASFAFPVLSWRADLRMCRLMLAGRMEREIIRLRHDILRYR